MQLQRQRALGRRKTDELFLDTESAFQDDRAVADLSIMRAREAPWTCDFDPTAPRNSTLSLPTWSRDVNHTATLRRHSADEARPPRDEEDGNHSMETNPLLSAARSRRRRRQASARNLNSQLADSTITSPTSLPSLSELEGDSVYELDTEPLAELPVSPSYVAYSPGLVSPSMLSLQKVSPASPNREQALPEAAITLQAQSAQTSPMAEPPLPPSPILSAILLEPSTQLAPTIEEPTARKRPIGRARSRKWLEHQASNG